MPYLNAPVWQVDFVVPFDDFSVRVFVLGKLRTVVVVVHPVAEVVRLGVLVVVAMMVVVVGMVMVVFSHHSQSKQHKYKRPHHFETQCGELMATGFKEHCFYTKQHNCNIIGSFAV